MRAVADKRAHAVSRAELLIPGPRTIDGIETPGRDLHPRPSRDEGPGLTLASAGARCWPSWSVPAPVTTGRRPADLVARLRPAIRRCAAACWSNGASRACSRRRCVGALLGLGGAVFQGVFRNPLAEPYLLGSAGGAALGATVALLVPLRDRRSRSCCPLLAFAGAWGATVLVIGISRVAGRRRCRRHAAGRRRRRRDPGRAALLPDAGAVGRDGEPADRAELGAGRRADADLADARPAGR